MSREQIKEAAWRSEISFMEYIDGARDAFRASYIALIEHENPIPLLERTMALTHEARCVAMEFRDHCVPMIANERGVKP